MMMMDGSSSLTLQVPSMIASNPSGGRFDFDDGGTYCGGWQDGKAHGHGVCTGPKNVGEYSGSWNFGFEMSGVYRWKNGAVYEGRWQNGKRHGVGVEYNGKWIYKGEWSQGYKGRYGVKASSNSAVKYEGTWANGLQDGYGSETYSDGGYYQGQMCKGLRHGYGVRKSAPYGDSQLTNPNKNGQLSSGTGLSSSMLIHSNSLQSSGSVDLDDPDSPKPEDGFKPHCERTLASKNGFVLVAKPLDLPSSLAKFSGDTSSAGGRNSSKSRRNSLTNKLASTRIPGSNQTASLLRGLRLRKQKSTSDLETLSGGRQTPAGARERSAGQQQSAGDLLAQVPFSLSPEELDITDPTTVETYMGEWKADKRNGHGVCDRSDGLKYEGQWHNDMKCGYGVTTFKNGTKEEGKYKNNILIADSKVKRFFQIGSANIRQRIDEAIKMAQQTQTMALKKAEIADTRAATARDKADQATTAALEADRDSKIAWSVARQYSSDSSQQQQQFGLAASNANALYPLGMAPANLLGAGLQQEPMMPGALGMPNSSLQARRVSQQPNAANRYAPYNQAAGEQQQQANELEQQQQQQQANQAQMQQQPQQQQQQQYLAAGNVEPFNGRRGSFRGGGSQHSMGSQRAPFAAQLAPPAGYGMQPANRQPADPFNDLFDHYKSSASQQAFPMGRKQMYRQTSLDYNKMRASAPRQLAAGSFQAAEQAANSAGQARNSRLFRMSSMDHAEENQRQQTRGSNSSSNLQEQLQSNRQAELADPQQQFRHLVTSGEELEQQNQLQQQQQQQQQQQPQQHQQQQHLHRSSGNSNLEPAQSTEGSSYILPQSTNSSFFGNTQTPSPSDGGQSSLRSPSSQFYSQQQQAQAQAYARYAAGQFHSALGKPQRDVHSLADEQLYSAAGRRFYGASMLDKTDYANYDFTISSSPPLSRRCMRRTASLSRNTPIKSSEALDESLAGSRRPLDAAASSRLRRSPSPSPAQQLAKITLTAAPSLSIERAELEPAAANQLGVAQQPTANHLVSPDNSSASSAASSALNRKPSLQVRYDPVEIGGLMSREEAAKLSHAQREQRRQEAELAEQRAKRPILHLCMSLGGFISQQRLLLSVFVFNLCLIKMFADLIAG